MQQRFYEEFERDFYTKIIVTVIPTNLVTSLLSFLFCPFIEIKNKIQIFSKLVVWYREIVLLSIYSESRSTSNVCQIEQSFIKGFSCRLFRVVLQFHDYSFFFFHSFNFSYNVKFTPFPTKYRNKITIIITICGRAYTIDDSNKKFLLQRQGLQES